MNSDRRIISIGDILLPSKRQLICYIILVLVIIAINTGFMQDLIAQFRESNQITLPFINNIYQSVSDSINQDSSFGKLSVGLVWGIIGAVVYLLMWLAGNVLGEMRNVVVEELYFVKPKSNSLWHGRLLLLSQIAYRMGLIILIACFTMVVASVVIPITMESVRIALNKSPQLSTYLYGLASLLLVTVAIHGVIILVKLLVVRDTSSQHGV